LNHSLIPGFINNEIYLYEKKIIFLGESKENR
jgi:hypothetical protein